MVDTNCFMCRHLSFCVILVVADQHVVSLQTPAAVHRRMVTTVRLLEIVITAALFFSQHWAGILKLSGPTPSSDAAAHAALASTMLAFGCVAMLLVNVLGALNAGQVRIRMLTSLRVASKHAHCMCDHTTLRLVIDYNRA